jgi:hypothetical protein
MHMLTPKQGCSLLGWLLLKQGGSAATVKIEILTLLAVDKGSMAKQQTG